MSIRRFFLCLFFIATVVWSHCYGDPAEWRVDARCFLDGPSGEFDDISVKDPSIVYSGGKWHLFYTGRDVGVGGNFRMGYASATTIPELNSATRHYLSSLTGGSYFCAPQVFWFEEKGTWYLIYQSGLGPTFSTNTDISNPSGWTAGISMGFSGGVVDYWCISDGSYVYCFYSPLGTTILRRSTTVADFPYNWSSASTVATDTFEAPHVYKNKADGMYYMMVEDVARHFELWTASDPGGTWTKLQENWAHGDQLVFNADHWTDQVSHGEIIRAGINEKLEISDINRCDILIQGVVDGSYGDYGNIPYDLGIIRNFPGGTLQTLNCSSTTGGSVIIPGEGDFQYVQDSNAPIEAAADSYYHFTVWSGSAVTAGKVADPCAISTTVLMDANYAVVANFELDPLDNTPPSPSTMTWASPPAASRIGRK